MYYRCVSYGYPDLETFPTVIGGSGFVIDRNGSQIPTQVFPNQIILDELGIPTLAQLDNSQVNIIFSICYWQHVYLESCTIGIKQPLLNMDIVMKTMVHFF